MEIMIKRLKIVLLFCAVACNSQIVDTITIHCNLEYYKKVASKRVELQYAFTQKNYNELKKIYKSNKDTLLILTDLPLKSFEVHSIPFFKIKDDLITNFKENFVNSINFSNNLKDQGYTLYLKDKIYADFLTFDDIQFTDLDIIFDSLIAINYNNPIIVGEGPAYLLFLKLNLEAKYFTFFIKGLNGDAMFIVDNGIVYAISNPTNEGTYKKTEINEFFANYIGKDTLNDIILLGHKKFKKKKNKVAKTKFYNKKYYVKIID